MGWVVNVTPRQLYPGESDPVPIVLEAGWAPGASLHGRGKFRHHRDSIPGPPSPQQVAILTELSRPTVVRLGRSIKSEFHQNLFIYLFLFKKSINNWRYVASDCVQQWIENYIEGSERDVTEGHIPKFSWNDRRKPTEPSVGSLTVTADIPTGHLRKKTKIFTASSNLIGFIHTLGVTFSCSVWLTEHRTRNEQQRAGFDTDNH
jgi:hypothetical protein